MLLLPCFVRSVALIESEAAGISLIHMSAEKWKGMQERADSSAASMNAQTNENKVISFQHINVCNFLQ